MDEIVNSMLGGVETSGDGRPRDRTLRRSGSAEPFELATLSQTIQVREHGPVVFHEMRIHAIDAQYNHLLSHWP